VLRNRGILHLNNYEAVIYSCCERAPRLGITLIAVTVIFKCLTGDHSPG
jgi:hypothetical protein